LRFDYLWIKFYINIFPQDDAVDESPVANRKRKLASSSNPVSGRRISDVTPPAVKKTPPRHAPVNTDNKEVFLHETLSFLQPDKIRDAKRRKPVDENYDKTTLFVPDDFILRQTPAMCQWWKLKSGHFDTILCFKVIFFGFFTFASFAGA